MFGRDLSETTLLEQNPKILDILLFDHTTKKNIIWATDNYKRKGKPYYKEMQILPELITKKNSNLIKPRVDKSKTEQSKRSKDNAEVFTPSWICNKQNNLVDNEWFGYDNPFNIEKDDLTWIPTNKVKFPKNKDWKEYVSDIRLEISCGEAPYLVSRYDAVTGDLLDINNRIGLLDRKFRVIIENVGSDEEWNEMSLLALKSVYGFEFQGDNLLIARENVFLSYLDYFEERFNTTPSEKIMLEVAEIISWNLWQMDGLKLVVPYSCHKEETVQMNLFEDVKPKFCAGCRNDDIKAHNGKYCIIMDWEKNKHIKYVDLVR